MVLRNLVTLTAKCWVLKISEDCDKHKSASSHEIATKLFLSFLDLGLKPGPCVHCTCSATKLHLLQITFTMFMMSSIHVHKGFLGWQSRVELRKNVPLFFFFFFKGTKEKIESPRLNKIYEFEDWHLLGSGFQLSSVRKSVKLNTIPECWSWGTSL